MRGWPEYPLVLDIEAGRPVVFSIMPISPACEQYVKYVYRSGAWNEEPLPGRFEARTTNLYLSEEGDVKLVNLAEKLKETLNKVQAS